MRSPSFSFVLRMSNSFVEQERSDGDRETVAKFRRIWIWRACAVFAVTSIVFTPCETSGAHTTLFHHAPTVLQSKATVAPVTTPLLTGYKPTASNNVGQTTPVNRPLGPRPVKLASHASHSHLPTVVAVPEGLWGFTTVYVVTLFVGCLARRTSSPLTSREPAETLSLQAPRPEALSMMTASGELGKSNAPTLFTLLTMLIADVTLWCVAYFWFFKTIMLTERVVAFNPALEFPVFVVLSLLPTLCLRFKVFEASIGRTLRALKVLTRRSVVINHIIETAIQPLSRAFEMTLVFFASNLLVNATPNNWSIKLPSHWVFLDPNGDGILSALEIQGGFHKWSQGLLLAVLATTLGRWLLSAKAPPAHYEDEAAESERGVIRRYWMGLRKGRGPAMVIDLFLSLSIVAATALEWLKFLNISPQTVLTFGGVGGLALGLASQTVVGNVVSGLLLLVTQPFAIGDKIYTGERQGVVKGIGWSSTKIEEDDGSIVIIPNQSVVDTDTVNLSLTQNRMLTFTLPFRVPKGGTDTCRQLLATIKTQLKTHPALEGILVEEPDAVLDYENSKPSITVEAVLDGQVVSDDDLAPIKSDVLISVMDTIRAAGCKIGGLT